MPRSHGFTLVEMILTMIVSSILLLGIASFVELGMSGYADTVVRQKIQIQAQFVLEKLSRELRSSVPNSIATNIEPDGRDCVSFYPTRHAGFYALNPREKQLTFLVNNPPVEADYDELSAIINPSRQADFSSSTGQALVLTEQSLQINACDDEPDNLACNTVTINNFSPSLLKGRSISNRIYLFNQKVSYCLNTATGMMTRKVGEGSNSVGVNVADSLHSGSFTYEAPTLQRGGLVRIALTFSQRDEESHYQKDVQVLNAP